MGAMGGTTANDAGPKAASGIGGGVKLSGGRAGLEVL